MASARNKASNQAGQRPSSFTNYPIVAGPQNSNAVIIMKRVILTDSRTKVSQLFESPPWRLGQIRQCRDSDTFDVRMVHDNGKEIVINVNADRMSLTNRFKGW